MKIFEKFKFRDFLDVSAFREPRIRIERIKRIQFGVANFKIDGILMGYTDFLDFRISEVSGGSRVFWHFSR